jgi:hypothetical protein
MNPKRCLVVFLSILLISFSGPMTYGASKALDKNKSQGLKTAPKVKVPTIPKKETRKPAEPAKPVAPTKEIKKLDKGPIAPEPRLPPDLIVQNIYLTADCKVAVTVKNQGPGSMPDEVWTIRSTNSADVYIYSNGGAWGGSAIWSFDPVRRLQRPGGTATFVSYLEVDGTFDIRAEVDHNLKVTEINEGNNSLEKSLTCPAEPVVVGGTCCIAGRYQGIMTDKPSTSCSTPKARPFLFTIIQPACGLTLEGEFQFISSDSPGPTHRFTGRVSHVDPCCRIAGSLRGLPGTSAEGEGIKLNVTLCKEGGKWLSTEGTFGSTTGCGGTLSVEQQ